MLDARSPISRLALVVSALAVTVGCGGARRPAESASSGHAGGGYGGGGYAETTVVASEGGGHDSDGVSDSSGTSYAPPPTMAPPPTTMAPPSSYSPPPVAAAPAKAPMSAGASGGGYAPTAPAPVALPPVAAGKKEGASKAAPAGTPVTIETKTTVTIVTPPPPTPYPPPGYEQESPTGGILTAAIWDDDAMRPQFTNFVARYPQFNAQWGVDMTKRVTIRVEDSNGVAVGDAPIALRAPDGSVVNLRAHGDGQTYFWPTTSMLHAATYSQNQQQPGTFSVAAQVGGLRTETAFSAPATDTTWTVKLKGVPTRAQQPALDVAFVVDCTGSMGDEIAYLQNELIGVVKRAKSEHGTRRVRLGLVLYRDRGDDYVTKSFNFTEDLNTYLNELKTAQAMGGGDIPESVNAALSDTVSKLDWAGDETGRLAILVGDAPPHYYADEQYTYKNAIVDLNARGVKLVTVGASGIDKSTEYLFREMSAYTGGRYVFLTDDSGVGDSHITPDITGYQVEHLDKILVRVIGDEARAFKR